VVKGEEEKRSAISRGFRLGKLGFGLVGSYLGYQAQNWLLGEEGEAQRQSKFRQKASRRVREELGEMKGPAMKLGQMMSMHSDKLPQEALQELAQLQMRAPGMHASLARAQFKSALGKYPEEVFREFSPEPIAAASLGQVHRAKTKAGEDVAVKIQYPAIRAAIENDFKLLRSATLPTRITGHIPTGLIDEIERGLLEETNYEREADNMEKFHEGLRGLEYLTVPRPHRELSSDRVLTMSFVEGESFGAFLQRKHAQAFRDMMGERLVEMYDSQLKRLKLIHADQHPGNFLFRPDGRIGLVDFGCVKRISFDVMELRRGYAERVWKKGDAEARKFLRLVYGPDASYERARRSLPVLERFADVIFPKDFKGDLVIEFGADGDWQKKTKDITEEFQMRLLRDKLINPEYAFIVRAEMGLHHLLRELGARISFSKLWRDIPDWRKKD